MKKLNALYKPMNGNWKAGTEAWGVKVLGDVLQVLGLNNNKQELKLAKFVDGTNTNVWHGYPADYVSKSQDRPATNILKIWVDSGYLTKAKMSKIRLGQIMQPVKITIKGDYYDCQIYRGRLYLWTF